MNPARRSLLAYGADIPDLMRRGAAQTAKILKGARPGCRSNRPRASTSWST